MHVQGGAVVKKGQDKVTKKRKKTLADKLGAKNASDKLNEKANSDVVGNLLQEIDETTKQRKRNEMREFFKQKRLVYLEKLGQEREQFDSKLRTEPHTLLWQEYVDWAGDRLTNVERKQEQWSADQVIFLEDSNPGGDNMMDEVKAVIGEDYKTRTGFEKNKSKDIKPSVACLMICPSTESVLSFAKRLYDGRPVGKFFSRHMKVEHQAAFLKKACQSSILPTATGNVSRLDRLLTDEALTLDYTQALLVDFGRDSKRFNIAEHNYRDTFFELIHKHVRPWLASGMKIVLVVPPREKMTIS